MAIAQGLTENRNSPNDLGITFEVNGETVSVYISDQALSTQSIDDLAAMFDRRLRCALCCKGKTSFGLCVARCLSDGKCCDGGTTNCD